MAPRLRLAEQEASTSDSMRPYNPSSRLSSEPLHDRISTEGLDTRRARSEATTSHSARPRSQPPRRSRASTENQLSQEHHLHTRRSVADEHEHWLVRPTLDTDTFDKGERQEVEAEEADDEDNDKDDGQPQQEVNGVAAALTAERVGDAHLSGKEDGSPRPAERQQSLPNSDLSPEPSQEGAGRDSRSDDELNNTDLDDDEEEPRPMKRKRPSLSCDGPMHKKRKHRLQQRSTRQHRPHPKPHGRSPKSLSLLDQDSTVAAVSSAEGRLPSPAPSTPHATDTDMSPDCCNLDRSSGAAPPTLTEITFRPHSPHCCSFTAVIRDGCAERGVSFSQVVRLITSIGHMGKIDDFTIKPVEQHSFLLTGFSRHTSSRPSFGGTTLSTAAEAGRDQVDTTRTRLLEGRAVNAGALASRRSKPLINDNDSGLSDSDSESSGDDDECSSEDEGCSSTSKHSRWSDLDEQRLVAYALEHDTAQRRLGILLQLDRQQLKLCVPTCPLASAGTNAWEGILSFIGKSRRGSRYDRGKRRSKRGRGGRGDQMHSETPQRK
ncbi:hypothetical protein DL98DRAFT_133862 [Cadophora sp. DSE1049]|nr:hypothetical protein DL98DRAFT_133862 [Cadophora sp. DSE1049]